MTQYANQNHGQQNQGQSKQDYYNRYQRGTSVWWKSFAEKLFDSGPGILAILGWAIALGCLGTLEIMDIVVGRVTAAYMTNGQNDLLFSMATTGLALALMGTMFYGWRERWSLWFLIPLGLGAFIPYAIDIINDGMAVDIYRFGRFISTSAQFGSNSSIEAVMHNLYRIMFAGMSAMGEPIAAASIVIFPIMKDLFRGAFK